MSESAEQFVARCHAAIIEIEDPVELQRQLREMVEDSFPVAKPLFVQGEAMRMHEFDRRLRSAWCHNIEPEFARLEVAISGTEDQLGYLVVEIYRPNSLNLSAPSTPAPEAAKG